jgi:hypothetical protein
VIRWARCSALVRDRPMVVMTLRVSWRKADQPDLIGGSASGAGGAGVDLDGDGSLSHVCFLGRWWGVGGCWLRTRHGWATRGRAGSY